MRLLITIDAEEDDAWSVGRSVSTENVRYTGRFQDLCERHGYRPTYLATEPVLLDRGFAGGLAAAVSDGRAEVGIHLHPWSCGPFDGATPDARTSRAYPHEIGTTELRVKLARLAGLVRERFGIAPLTYRAGRWGFDSRQVRPLLDCGIRVDCSVTPHISWQQYRGHPDGNGGPDFRGAPPQPYWVDAIDARVPGSSDLLELPMTVLYARGPFASWDAAFDQLDRLRYRAPGKAMARLGWMPRLFRPLPRTSLADLLRMQRAANRLGLPYVMLMLHSSELMPGGSPYFPDEASVEELYRLLDRLLGSLRRSGLDGATLCDFARPYLTGATQALGGTLRQEAS